MFVLTGNYQDRTDSKYKFRIRHLNQKAEDSVSVAAVHAAGVSVVVTHYDIRLSGEEGFGCGRVMLAEQVEAITETDVCDKDLDKFQSLKKFLIGGPALIAINRNDDNPTVELEFDGREFFYQPHDATGQRLARRYPTAFREVTLGPSGILAQLA